jgi:hypothetical protein
MKGRAQTNNAARIPIGNVKAVSVHPETGDEA